MNGLKVPSKATLKKYGLSAEAWIAIARRQDFQCFICQKTPSSGRLNVDHEHVKGWKKMTPEKRRLYVRALLCFVCNHRVMTRGMSLDKALRVVKLFESYNWRTCL